MSISSILSNINRVIHQTHAVVRSLVLKGVAILLTIVHDELNNIGVRIRDLDRICLNMCDRITTLVDLVLEVDHEQSSTLGYDVVLVANITEWVVELSRCQTIHAVNRNLQSLCQVSGCYLIIEVLSKLSIQHLTSLVKILMLDCDTCISNLLESLRILLTEQLLSNNT